MSGPGDGQLPHRIAVLCYLYDGEGRMLLLHRRQEPNIGMYSPIGGKLDVQSGEGPHACAVREIAEETGLLLNRRDVRMTGIVTERAYQDEAHWLIFLFEVVAVVRPGDLKWTEFKEGSLQWKPIAEVADLPIPRTDRDVMWPLVQAHRGGFFVVHIEWGPQEITWTVHESVRGTPDPEIQESGGR